MIDPRGKIDIRPLHGTVAGSHKPAACNFEDVITRPDTWVMPYRLIAKKITLPNRQTFQLPLVRMQWQEFSVSAATLSLHPKRYALARSKNVVITSESARRKREGSAFGRNSVPLIWREIRFFGCPTPLA